MTKNFMSFADSMNPKAINISNGNEEYVLNTQATHLVQVMDKKGNFQIVIGKRYDLLKYIETLQGNYKHTRIQTVNQYAKTLHS